MVKSDSGSVERLLQSFSRTVDDIVTLSEFREKLLSGKQLVFKYGVDLTAPDLHIGHAVNLWMYRELQELGHRVVLLLGDFTTQIGDPTGRSKTRPVLTAAEIEANARAIQDQAMAVLIDDPQVLSVRRNSEWLNRLSPAQLLTLMSSTTVDKLLSRDMFRKRTIAGQAISAHELVYPLLQGWDSVELHADGTVIGSDQLFNEMMGRSLQEREGLPPQVVITSKITPGIDGGEKQSKSLGNYVAIGHLPRDKFGRLMRVPDNLVDEYLRVYTSIDDAKIAEILDVQANSPIEAKSLMASEIVARWHGPEVAQAEATWFDSTFRQKQAPSDAAVIEMGSGSTMLDVVRAIDPSLSNTAIRRLFADGGVRVDGEKAADPNAAFEASSTYIQVGKRRRATVRSAPATTAPAEG